MTVLRPHCIGRRPNGKNFIFLDNAISKVDGKHVADVVIPALARSVKGRDNGIVAAFKLLLVKRAARQLHPFSGKRVDPVDVAGHVAQLFHLLDHTLGVGHGQLKAIVLKNGQAVLIGLVAEVVDGLSHVDAAHPLKAGQGLDLLQGGVCYPVEHGSSGGDSPHGDIGDDEVADHSV